MPPASIYMPENHMDKLYNSRNFLVRFVHRNRLKTIVSLLPDQSSFKILDAGCGEGHLLELLNQFNSQNEYYGVDLTQEALVKAQERCPLAHLSQADLKNIKFPDNFFDFIVCTETLEHIDDYKKVIIELKRVLKPGGRLIITFPNEILWTISRFFLGRRPIKVVDHINFFTPPKIGQVVDLKIIKKIGLPLRLPFFMSLGYLVVFRK